MKRPPLVWQLLCSVPMNMMIKFPSWLSTYLSHALRNFLIKIMPKETSFHSGFSVEYDGNGNVSLYNSG